MPRSDAVFISALRESPEGIVVAQWAVAHSMYGPRERVVRDHPFRAFMIEPMSPASCRLTVCMITIVPCFMPYVSVREELEKGIRDLEDLKNLPNSSDVNKALKMIQKEVWTLASQELRPCLWHLFQSVAPEISELGIEHKPKQASQVVLPLEIAPGDLLGTLCGLGVEDPVRAGAVALAFSIGPSWRELCRGHRQPGEVVIWKHDSIANAVRASASIFGAHPMVIALTLQQPEFKRQSDTSIFELREVRKVNDFCTVFYQRSHVKLSYHDRDDVYACALLDLTSDRTLLLEWPVQLDECPTLTKVTRSRSLLLYDLQRSQNQQDCTELTITAVVDTGGFLGSRFLQPMMRGQVAKEISKNVGEMQHFFCKDEGLATRKQVEVELVQQICQELRKQLTPLQLSFMENYSSVFSPAALV